MWLFAGYVAVRLSGWQTSLSLQEAFSRAHAHQPILARYAADAEAAFSRVGQAASGLLPSINIQGAASDGPIGAPIFGPLENPAFLGTLPLTLEGITADPLKKQFGGGITLNQTLFDSGRTSHLVAARRALAHAADQDLYSAGASVELAVAQAYFDVMHGQQLLAIARQDVAHREATVAQAKAFSDNGLKSGVDYDLEAAALADAKVSLIAAQNQVHYLFAVLNNAMGETSSAEYDLDKRFQAPSLPSNVNEAMDRASAQRPEVLAAQSQLRAGSDTLKGVRSEFLPRLDAIASAGVINDSSLIKNNKNYAVGVALTLPLYTGGLVEGRIKEEQKRLDSLKAREKDAEETVRLQAAKAWYELETRRASLASAAEQLKAADESLKLATERYRLQLSAITELTEAEAAELRAATAVADAEYALMTAQATLAWSIGTRIGGR